MHESSGTVNIIAPRTRLMDQEVTMTKEEQHARVVINKMRSFCSQADELMALHKPRLNRLEKDELQQRFRLLKEEIKRYAKTGTVDGERRERSECEEFFFAPAVTTAAANILESVNADPATQKWFSCVYGINTDIGSMLSQLEEQYPD